ncbi:hypothetical protein [Janthinobacterium fluminis]|uniref:Sel1 repeat family protein n=1 Tax=Janthinobacterium fluminis TaxID=2987524 RepID=A0ABT5JWY5_9BURK|nr:hypothetical protein [Janthinobacterium fluminis]MDC8757253.1 hypothetical protein [Janthinobacterium fluminis]
MMSKLSLAFYLCAACGPALADELADAQKLWDNKEFVRAFQGFSALAKAGHSAAQLQLGEMYGFGEGTPEDAGKAADWLNLAAAAGNREAPLALALVRERAARKNEIDYYVAHFDGAAVSYASHACVRPVIPAVSTSNGDIQATNAAVGAWRDCYGRFAAALNGAMPVTNTIPAGLLKLMNNDEFVRAGARISTTYARIAAEAQQIADQIVAENAAWKRATDAYVEKNNQELHSRLGQEAAVYERNQRDAAEGRLIHQAKENAAKKTSGR